MKHRAASPTAAMRKIDSLQEALQVRLMLQQLQAA